MLVVYCGLPAYKVYMLAVSYRNCRSCSYFFEIMEMVQKFGVRKVYFMDIRHEDDLGEERGFFLVARSHIVRIY